MIEPEFLLTPRQLDVVWHDLGAGRLPYPLDVPSLGGTEEDRARLRDEVGQPSPRLADLLLLLGRGRVAVDGVADLGRVVRAVAVSDGARAVLAVIDDDRIGLLEVRPTALAHAVVEILPDGTAGPGNALSLPVTALSQAVTQDFAESDDPWGDAGLGEREALHRAGVSREDATALTELAAGRVAGGQFGVSVGGSRVGALVTWFDTAHGRYLMVNEHGWLSLAPTDNDRIAHRLTTVLSAFA
ncbi:ESX secretion-associated protein EspG [Saccharothrix violaceirubra]|uniref:ESAT-6 protein secretion system EspG family protein n=1 Tax=Saccharothrix violaceirubra TaxID=413306 RepID=A0A7W7SYJ2_9PSEU|nr:ESX secretion-associated protein EspG [Saccharothrix violaceirubra]MBB4963306.1 hypothetical protein [Saccharothrix violaceirubra]